MDNTFLITLILLKVFINLTCSTRSNIEFKTSDDYDVYITKCLAAIKNDDKWW